MRAKGLSIGLRHWKRILFVIPLLLVAAAGFFYFRATAEGETRKYVIFDRDDVMTLESFSGDTASALEASGISLDGAWYTVSEDADCTVITISRNPTVLVTCDGVDNVLMTASETVGDVLAELGIALDADDIVTCSLSDAVQDGMEIAVKRVEIDYPEVETPIYYETEYVDDDTIEKGKAVTVTEGREGVRLRIYRRVYVDGVLEELTTESDTVAEEAVNTVVHVGTKEPPKPVQPAPSTKTTASKTTSSGSKSSSSGSSSSSSSSSGSKSSSSSGGSKSSGSSSSSSGSKSATSSPSSSVNEEAGTITTSSGATYTYSKVLSMTATAYTYSSNSKMNITSSGVPVQVGVVAALPSTIPQGTKVYIVSAYGTWEYGIATVGDTPGTNIIDLFMETEKECRNFGVKDALVYILD